MLLSVLVRLVINMVRLAFNVKGLGHIIQMLVHPCVDQPMVATWTIGCIYGLWLQFV